MHHSHVNGAYTNTHTHVCECVGVCVLCVLVSERECVYVCVYIMVVCCAVACLAIGLIAGGWEIGCNRISHKDSSDWEEHWRNSGFCCVSLSLVV